MNLQLFKYNNQSKTNQNAASPILHPQMKQTMFPTPKSRPQFNLMQELSQDNQIAQTSLTFPFLMMMMISQSHPHHQFQQSSSHNRLNVRFLRTMNRKEKTVQITNCLQLRDQDLFLLGIVRSIMGPHQAQQPMMYLLLIDFVR